MEGYHEMMRVEGKEQPTSGRCPDKRLFRALSSSRANEKGYVKGKEIIPIRDGATRVENAGRKLPSTTEIHTRLERRLPQA
jgi:hypothetical protein